MDLGANSTKKSPTSASFSVPRELLLCVATDCLCTWLELGGLLSSLVQGHLTNTLTQAWPWRRSRQSQVYNFASGMPQSSSGSCLFRLFALQLSVLVAVAATSSNATSSTTFVRSASAH